MNDFFKEFATQLAKRWISLLAVPGVLYVATCLIARRLGQAHALAVHRLTDAIGSLGAAPGCGPATPQALTVVAALLASAAVGLIAQALTAPVRALYLGEWPRWVGFLASALTRRRSRRWNELLRQRHDLESRYPSLTRTNEQQRQINRIAHRVNAIALAEPARPTWMGDRVHALSEAALNRYGLDLTFGWSRLWLALPDSARSEITTAQESFAVSLLTTAWSIPYVVLAAWWWPAIVIAVSVGATGWLHSRRRISILTDLLEATLDVHGRSLAVQLGVSAPEINGPLTPGEGQAITHIVRKGR